MDSTSEQQEIDISKLKETVITEEFIPSSEADGDRVVLVDSGDNSTAEEQVLGYLEVQPSDLQAVTEGGTIYLSSEDLNQHLILGDEGGEYIVVVGSEEEALAALASAEGEIKLQAIRGDQQEAKDHLTEVEQFVADEVMIHQNDVNELSSHQVLMHLAEENSKEDELSKTGVPMTEGVIEIDEDSAHRTFEIEQDVSIENQGVSVEIPQVEGGGSTCVDPSEIIHIEPGELTPVASNVNLVLNTGELTDENSVTVENETHLACIEPVYESSQEVTLQENLVSVVDLATEDQSAECNVVLTPVLQEVSLSNEPVISNDFEDLKLKHSHISYATNSGESNSASSTLTLMNVEQEIETKEPSEISGAQDSVLSNVSSVESVLEVLPRGLDQLVEAAINASNQEPHKEKQVIQTGTVSDPIVVSDVSETVQVIDISQIDELVSDSPDVEVILQKTKQLKEKVQLESRIIKSSKVVDNEAKEKQSSKVQRTVICVTPKDQISLKKAEDLARKLSDSTKEDAVAVLQPGSASPKSVLNQTFGQISVKSNEQKSVRKIISPITETAKKPELPSFKTEQLTSNKLQDSLQLNQSKPVPVVSTPSRVCKPAIVRLSRADAPAKNLLCSAKPSTGEPNAPVNKLQISPKPIISAIASEQTNSTSLITSNIVVRESSCSKVISKTLSVVKSNDKPFLSVKDGSKAKESYKRDLSALLSSSNVSENMVRKSKNVESSDMVFLSDSSVSRLPSKTPNLPASLNLEISVDKSVVGKTKPTHRSSETSVLKEKTSLDNSGATVSNTIVLVGEIHDEVKLVKEPIAKKTEDSPLQNKSESDGKKVGSLRTTRQSAQHQQEIKGNTKPKGDNKVTQSEKGADNKPVVADETVSHSKKSTPEKHVENKEKNDGTPKRTRSKVAQVGTPTERVVIDSPNAKDKISVSTSKPNRNAVLSPVILKGKSRVSTDKPNTSVLINPVTDVTNLPEVETNQDETDQKLLKELEESDTKTKNPQQIETGVVTRRGQRSIKSAQLKEEQKVISSEVPKSSSSDYCDSDISTGTNSTEQLSSGNTTVSTSEQGTVPTSVCENTLLPINDSLDKDQASLKSNIITRVKTRNGGRFIPESDPAKGDDRVTSESKCLTTSISPITPLLKNEDKEAQKKISSPVLVTSAKENPGNSVEEQQGGSETSDSRRTRSSSRRSTQATIPSSPLISKTPKGTKAVKGNNHNMTSKESTQVESGSTDNKSIVDDNADPEIDFNLDIDEEGLEILPLHIRLGIDRTYSKASPLTVAPDEEQEQGESLEISFRLDSEENVNLPCSSGSETVVNDSLHADKLENVEGDLDKTDRESKENTSEGISKSESSVEKVSIEQSVPTSLESSNDSKVSENNSSSDAKTKTKKVNLELPEVSSENKTKTRTSLRRKSAPRVSDDKEVSVATEPVKDTSLKDVLVPEDVTNNRTESVLKELTETNVVTEQKKGNDGNEEKKKVNKRRSLPNEKSQSSESAKKAKRVSFGGKGFHEKTADQRFDDMLKRTATPFKGYNIGTPKRKRNSLGVILATPPKKPLVRLHGTKLLKKYRRNTTGNIGLPKREYDSSDEDMTPNVLRTYTGGKFSPRKSASEPKKTITIKHLKTNQKEKRKQAETIKNSPVVNSGIQKSPLKTKCQFHICCQGPSPPEMRSPNTTYTCKECHYRTNRIENIIHHYKECTILLNQEMLQWDKVGEKTPTRFIQEPIKSSPVTSYLSSSMRTSITEGRSDHVRTNLSNRLGTPATPKNSVAALSGKSENLSDALDSDDSEELPIIDITWKTTFGFIENDIVWVDWRNDQWPALVQKIFTKQRKALVYLIESQFPEKEIKVNVRKLTTFDDAARNKQFLSKGGPNSSKVKAVQKAEDYLRKRFLGMKINPLPFFNNPDDVQSYLLEREESDEDEIQDVVPSPEMDTEHLVQDDKLANDEETEEMPTTEFSSPSADELDSTKLRLKEENRKLLDCIKEGNVEKHLLDVYHGKVSSERHEKFHSSVASVRNQLKHSTWFGPLETEDQRDEIIQYTMKLFKEEIGKPDYFDVVAYVFEVWIPEALVQAIMKVYNLNASEGEARFARGSDWLPQDLIIHQEVEELCCEPGPLDPLSSKRQKVIEKLRAIGIQEELLQIVPPSPVLRSNTQGTSESKG